MKNKNVSKIALSLLIALAFIMPMNAMAEGGEDAGEIQFSVIEGKQTFLEPQTAPIIESTLQNSMVNITGINLSANMPVDCYDINVTVCNGDLTMGQIPTACDIKLFMDIFKEEDMPREEIICFDFEDTGEIYNYWDSVDDTTDNTSGPGGIDTWTRSDARSVSPSHSMHNTQFDDHYMGNQLDYLMATIPIPEDYDELIVTFCSWVEGEAIDTDGDGETDTIHDYGWVEYSFDGITWTGFGDYYYDEPEWNCSKEYTITGASGETTLYWRFAWTSGPICNNEGWYVDDVCFFGREAPTLGQLVFTTHSLQEFTVPPGECIFYEFPETWCPDEGNYTIRIWMLSETVECEVYYPQADPFIFEITIKDIMDIAVTHNQIIHPIGDTFECEEYLLVNGTVCNLGTLDAYDVPVTFSISRQVKDTIFDDLVEGLYYPTDYIPYNFENPDASIIQAVNFGATIEDSEYSQSGFWHIDELNSVSPTHAWFNADDSNHYPAGIADNLAIIFEDVGIDLDELRDVQDWDITAEINIKINSSDRIFMTYLYGNTWASFGYTGQYGFEVLFGDDTGGFVPFSFKDIAIAAAPYYGFDGDIADGEHPLFAQMDYYTDAYAYGTPTGVAWYLDSDGRSDTNGFDQGTWSGVMIDNIKVESFDIGSEVYTEVIIIDELLVGECVEVEFMWDDIPTGDFIECKSVPDDDNNDNNELCDSFSVKKLWDEADEIEVESYDLTEGYECHWHVVTSGYNQYLWAGEDDPCTYGGNYNDILLFAPDGEPCMDWTGGSPITLELDEWCELEQGYDEVLFEVYPYCNDSGYQWYQYYQPSTHLDAETPYFADSYWGIGFADPDPLWTLFDGIGGQGWMQFAYGWGPDPGYYGGEAPLTPDQYYNSESYLYGYGPQDEQMVYGPIDVSTYTSCTIDWIATNILDFNTLVNEVNLWSGGPPGVGTLDMTTDYIAEAIGLTYYPGFVLGEPYTTSEWTFNPATLTDATQVFIEFDHVVLPFSVAYNSCLQVDDIRIIDGTVTAPPGSSNHGWIHNNTYNFLPSLFINPVTGDTFLNEIGSFTDQMEFRIRMISDSDTNFRGYMVDNVEIYNGGTIFELDECDTMDNFICDTVIGGDYWYWNATYEGWQCMDQIANVIPNDVDCALVWETSVPQAVAAELQFTHDFDLEEGYDFCYLEFSTDGGNSWIAPVRYTGIASGDVTIDMSSFTGDNVLIRWRVDTDAGVFSNFYRVKNMTIYVDIDIEPPVTTATLSGTVLYGWYSTPVTFTATAVDDYSGVANIFYKIDGGSTLTYSAPITISVNGEHYIEYWAVDNVGNEEMHHTTPTFMIDTGAAPSVSITAPGDGLYLFGNQLLSLSGRTIIIGGFTVEASASDSDSGVYRVQFALDGTTFGEDTTSPFSAYCGEKHTGAGTITVTAEDFTGQTASASKDITYFKFL